METTISEDSEYVIKITGSDVDSNNLKFKFEDTLGNKPQHGSVVLKDGQWVYVPNKDYVGTDTFKMTIFDEDGGSSTVEVTVTVTPTNDAPEAEEVKTVTGKEEATLEFKLTDYLKMSDVDTPIENLIYKVISAENGNVTYNPETGEVTYTGKKDFFGTDYITVQVDDGQGGVIEVKIPVNVENVNDAPTAEKDKLNVTVMQSGSVTGSLGVSDIDGDKLTYPSTVTSKNGLTVMIDENGNFTYKPGDGYKYQSDSFEVTVKDPSGESVTVRVDVKIDPKPLEQSAAKMSAFMADDWMDTNENSDQPHLPPAAIVDDLIFNVLSDDNLGGNTETVVDEFTLGDANDVIDISSLLSDDATTNNLAEFVTVEYDAENDQAVISIDRDGTGTDYESQNLVVLLNQPNKIELDDLINNNQIIY